MILRPDSLVEACALLRQGSFGIVAGATDLYARSRAEYGGPYLDLCGLAELSQIGKAPGAVVIGAGVTFSRLAMAELPVGMAALCEAAASVGGPQIRNRGTIGGNICNASPAADLLPPLLALHAELELASQSGKRRMSLAEFLGDGTATALRPDEILTSVILPETAFNTSRFIKLGRRRDMTIAVASICLALRWQDDGHVAEAGICVGAASRVPVRLPAVEHALTGLSLLEWADDLIDDAALAPLSPISDLRATADYRRHAVATLLRREIRCALSERYASR